MSLVLIIDDIPAMRDQYAYDLNRLGGFDTVTASGGAEGLTTLQTEPVDVVILDLEMPGVDGFEVLATLKRKGNRVPVIVYTGTGVLCWMRDLEAWARIIAGALETGGGEDDGVVVAIVQFGKPGIDVAAQRFDTQVGAHHLELRLAAQARASDQGAVGQIGKLPATGRHERVGMVGAFKHRSDTEALRHVGGHILHRVHSDVCIALLHGDLEFLDEQALTADLLQAAIENLVTPCGQGHQLDCVDFGESLEQRRGMFGLPERKRGFSCCYTNIHYQDSFRRRFTSATCRRLIISSLASTCDPSRNTTRLLPSAVLSTRSMRSGASTSCCASARTSTWSGVSTMPDGTADTTPR